MRNVTLLLFSILFVTSCSSIPLIKPLPPCDPSRFDMKTFKGRTEQAWCKVKEDAKHISSRDWHSKYDMESND